jgi:protein involved in polysaccharide export with SLBB domain
MNRMLFVFLFLALDLTKVLALDLGVVEPGDDEVRSDTYLGEDKHVYGDWIFNGGFEKNSFSGVNPEYKIGQGDVLVVQLWGGVDYQAEITVDTHGNVFIPRVGPVRVLGVANKDLNLVLLESIRRVYKSNVEAYVTLASSQTVKVFLAGMVAKPGVYEGQSADSILRFIDKAGGIKKGLGSYRNITVRRYGQLVGTMDLYSYLEEGVMPSLQLQDGDLIFVATRGGYVEVDGDVGFKGMYELKDEEASLQDIVNSVVKGERATHVTVVEPESREVVARQYLIEDMEDVVVNDGAVVRFSSQLKQKSISVEVLGEHDTQTEMVLPWGATLADLIEKVEFSPLSDKESIQLFRRSIAERQKEMLMSTLVALEQSVLTARSGTREAAELRKVEAESVLAWIDRAKKVEPRGQVLLASGYDPKKITLNHGDKISVPSKKHLVIIHGEVLFPTAVTFQSKVSIEDYVDMAGGSTGKLSNMNTLVMRPNGMFNTVARSELNDKGVVGPGDEIFVLAKPELKALQLTKDISQVIYQIAVSAAVALAL